MQFANQTLDLSAPKVMGVLNVTPDSFYDGGICHGQQGVDISLALERARVMVEQGADFIDVGGESTRPGAQPVPEILECERVVPVVEAIAKALDVVISVDTSTALVMKEAVSAGAGLINDVRALSREGAIEQAAQCAVPVCLMHMQGAPQSMQDSPTYDNAVEDVYGYLHARVQACIQAGLSAQNLLVDPGIGFGKTDTHNLALIARASQFSALGPVLLGVSRKSLIGRILGRPLEERLAGSLALAARGLEQGVSVLRVHDVAQTVDLVKLWQLTQA